MFDLKNPIFSDENKARAHLEGLRWPDGRYCPHCGETEKTSVVRGKRRGLYFCNILTEANKLMDILNETVALVKEKDGGLPLWLDKLWR